MHFVRCYGEIHTGTDDRISGGGRVSHAGGRGIQEKPLGDCRRARWTRSFRFLSSPLHSESGRPRVVARFLSVIRCPRRHLPGQVAGEAFRIPLSASAQLPEQWMSQSDDTLSVLLPREEELLLIRLSNIMCEMTTPSLFSIT